MAAGRACKNCTNPAEKDRAECSACRYARRSTSSLAPGVRVLAIDIETSPNLAHVWGLFDQTVSLSQLRESTEMLCFAAKWLGEKGTMFHSQHADGREAMVRAAHDLLDQADVLLHFNGKSFDVKHLNREFLLAGLTPPSPYRQIDLLLAARSKFKFPSNKLQYISTALGLTGKAKHEGHDLWVKCMAGDAAAWKRMERYNKQDVVLLEELYEKLLPWLPNHPNVNLYGTDGCPNCGSDKLHRRGYAYTGVSKYQQFHCTRCGSYFRSGKRESGVDLRSVAS